MNAEDEAHTENQMLEQAAQAIGTPLLDALGDLSDDDRERIAEALAEAVETGWKLGSQAVLRQLGKE